MARKLITYPDEILSRKAAPVECIDDSLHQLVKDMTRIMYENRGIGLAAPQVGEAVRLITVDISGPDKKEDLMVLINPEIVHSEGQCDSQEGCLSVVGYKSVVKRAEKVQVRAQDLKGREVLLEADDILATCIQHEIDHLDGVLFIDRISRLKRKLYDKRLSRWIRNRKD